MKKPVVLLLIALMIVGLSISCKPDPTPADFKGTWKGTASNGDEFEITFDGFGKVAFTVNCPAGTDESYEGSYSASDGFLTLTHKEEEKREPIYLYFHLVTPGDVESYPAYDLADDVGKYIFHHQNENSECVFPTDYIEADFNVPFTKEGDNYSAYVFLDPDNKTSVSFDSYKLTTPTATTTFSFADYKEDYNPDTDNELLLCVGFSLNYKCTEGGPTDPWNYKLEDCTEEIQEYKTQFRLTETTLTIYYSTESDETEAVVLTKQ